SSTRLREILVRQLGERGYLGLYSLVAFAAFFWLVAAYRQAPLAVLWIAPQWLKLAVIPVGLVAFLLAGVGLSTPQPTAVGAEQLLANPAVVRGILRVTRNPFLWGAGLWALAHMVVGGDVAALLLFGSIAVLGLVGTKLLEAKKARRHGTDWRAFVALTSNVPFQAILEGRQQLVWRLFVLVLWGHRWAFGVTPLPV